MDGGLSFIFVKKMRQNKVTLSDFLKQQTTTPLSALQQKYATFTTPLSVRYW